MAQVESANALQDPLDIHTRRFNDECHHSLSLSLSPLLKGQHNRTRSSLSDSADAQALWRTRPESLKPAGGIILCSIRQIAAHFFFEFVTFKLIVWDI